MVICMDMPSGERCYDEPQEAVGSVYDDEVLNANLVPPELALGLQERLCHRCLWNRPPCNLSEYTVLLQSGGWR